MGLGQQYKPKYIPTNLCTNSGFSLIELMVVVTIMGVLATLGVGALTEMVFKSRQTQAKSNLVILYTGYKNFHAEWNQYFGDWRNLGVEINGDLYYRVGAGASAGAISPPSPTDYIGPGVPAGVISSQHNSNPAYGNCSAVSTPGFPCVEVLDESCGIDIGSAYLSTDGSWSTHEFNLCACRKDYRTGALRRDRWYLNHRKEWTHELN